MSRQCSERGLCSTLISAKEGIGVWLRQNIEIIWEQPKTQEKLIYFIVEISITFENVMSVKGLPQLWVNCIGTVCKK